MGNCVASTNPCETARLLAQLGERVFMPLFLKPTREEFPGYAEDPIEALKLFLSAYAFERQGRSPHYPRLAVQALDELSNAQENLFESRDFSQRLWRTFLELGKFPDNGRGAACKVNPLWPGSDQGETHDLSAVAVCRKLKPHGYNLYRFARESLVQNRVRDAHDDLQRIRGVGAKIASLFLRDVALELEAGLPRHTEGRELLQPIDVCLRRSAERLLSRMPRDNQDGFRDNQDG